MKLEKNEFMLAIDATNGLLLMPELEYKQQILADIEDGIQNDELGKKWDLDGKKLIEKLRGYDEKEFKNLWEDIEKFWKKRDKNNGE